MKFFYQVILIVLFWTVGTTALSTLMALCLLLLIGGVWIVTKKGKLRIPHYIIVAFCLYLPFLILGLINNHPNPTIDIKFQFYGILFFLFLVNAKNLSFLRFLLVLNVIVSLGYILIYFGFLPSLWHDTIAGKGGRIYGPSIIPIVLIGFYYLYNRMAFDITLAISWLFAIVYLFLTSNLMNLVTGGILLLLIVINIRMLFKPGFIIGFALVIGGAVGFFNSDYTPTAIKEKLPYVFKPWEYESLKTRYEDFDAAKRSEDFTILEMLIGEGFGARTTVFRDNPVSVLLSGNETFQEIDNGFYYVYHRGGLLLLFIFLMAHIYLVRKIPSAKAKAGFIVVVLFTNLLSIHYFTNVFYLIIPFLILETESKKAKHIPIKNTDEN